MRPLYYMYYIADIIYSANPSWLPSGAAISVSIAVSIALSVLVVDKDR